MSPSLSSSEALQLRRDVGLIFQFPETQLFAETVAKDIAFGPQNLGLSDIDGRVDRALTRSASLRTFTAPATPSPSARREEARGHRRRARH